MAYGVLRVVLGIASLWVEAGDRNMPATATSSRQGIWRQYIVGSQVDQNGAVTVLLAEQAAQGAPPKYRVSQYAPDGRLKWALAVADDSELSGDPTLLAREGKPSVAWVTPGKGLVIAEIRDGSAKTETMVPEDPEEGIMSQFWLGRVGDANRLLLTRYRHVRGGERDDAGWRGERQYTWIYCYGLEKERPRLLGKACVEDDQVRSGELKFGSSGKDIVVWQSISEKGSLVQTVRCAEWNDRGDLVWRDRYTGNDPLGMLVDPSYGSTCLVKEWKSPDDASGVFCCMQKDATRVIPVGSYGTSHRDPMRFARLVGRKLWAVGRRDTDGVLLDFLGDDCSAYGSMRIDGRDIADFDIVCGQTQASVVLLRHGSLSIEPINMVKRPGIDR